MPEIKALFFDCDNTLALTEPIAFKFCALTMNDLMEEIGSPLRFSGPKLLKEFTGMNFRGMGLKLRELHNLSFTDEVLEKYVGKEVESVIEGIRAEAVECEGATEVVRRIYESGRYRGKMAVVSSSAYPRVAATLERVGMDKYFRNDKGELVIFSCASRVPPTSKPDPQIYIDAYEAFGVRPENCLTIEDSRSGAMSAINAKINVVGYVWPYAEEEKAGVRKVLNNCGANVLMEHWNEWDQCLKVVESQ